MHQALNWRKGTTDLHSAVPKLPTTDSCSIFLLDGFLLRFLDERSFCLISKRFRMCSWIAEHWSECNRNVHRCGCKPWIDVREPVNCTVGSRNCQLLTLAQTFYLMNEVCLISKCFRLCSSIAEHWSECNRNVHRCGCKSWIDVREPVTWTVRSRNCQLLTLA